MESSRASSPDSPREDGIAHPDTSRPNLGSVLGLLEGGGLPNPKPSDKNAAAANAGRLLHWEAWRTRGVPRSPATSASRLHKPPCSPRRPGRPGWPGPWWCSACTSAGSGTTAGPRAAPPWTAPRSSGRGGERESRRLASEPDGAPRCETTGRASQHAERLALSAPSQL